MNSSFLVAAERPQAAGANPLADFILERDMKIWEGRAEVGDRLSLDKQHNSDNERRYVVEPGIVHITGSGNGQNG